MFLGWSCLFADDTYFGLQNRVIEVFDRRWDAVVRVKAGSEETNELGETKWTVRVGSGFFSSADGLIVATFRAVEGAERLRYEYLDRTYDAVLVGADPTTNLALLRAVERPEVIDFVPVMDSGMPRIGTFVLSISCALEFDPAPSIGLVSGHEDRFGNRVFPTRYLRASIPANPGEGGSPVFDLEGRFLGVLIASLPEVNSSYIIPSRAVIRVLEGLGRGGEVEYGWIGIEVEERPKGQNGKGLFVMSLDRGGPAQRAGIEENDEIVNVDGDSIRNVGDLRNRFFFARIGETLTMTIRRGEEFRTFAVPVLEKP
ncbi:MAG: S1C family serine protease [Puniceicoccaceae bacterium]